MKKIKAFFRELARPVNLIITACILLFAYIWGGGVGKWEESELWSYGWWFNSAGHYIFGAGMALALLHWIKSYFPETYVWSSKFIIGFIIFATVNTLETDGWEGFERLWDGFLQPNFFPNHGKMQKGPDDTTLDVIITQLGCLTSLLAWAAYRKRFAKKYPDLAEREDVEEKKEQARMWAKGVLKKRQEYQKHILRDFFKNFRKKRRERKK